MMLTLFGGVLADRLPKRGTIVVTQILLMIQAVVFTLLVATGAIQLWHVYILAITQGIITAIDNPVRQAFIVEMVGKEDLMNAVSLNSMSFNGARILGPVVAGIVIERLDIAPTLFLNAISFIPVIWAMLLMNVSELRNTSVPPEGSVFSRLKEGLHYARHTPKILAVLIVIAAIGTFGYNFSVVMPLLGGYVLHTNAEQFGALSAFLGLGSMLAAIGSAYAGQASKSRLLGGSAAFAVVFCLLALSGNFVLSCVLLVILGFSGITFATTSNTLLQLNTPDALRGRVMSLNVLLFMGSTPIGALLIGIMSKLFGVSAALFICGVLCMTGVIGGWLYTKQPALASA
jgi:MFS family permease